MSYYHVSKDVAKILDSGQAHLLASADAMHQYTIVISTAIGKVKSPADLAAITDACLKMDADSESIRGCKSAVWQMLIMCKIRFAQDPEDYLDIYKFLHTTQVKRNFTGDTTCVIETFENELCELMCGKITEFDVAHKFYRRTGYRSEFLAKMIELASNSKQASRALREAETHPSPRLFKLAIAKRDQFIIAAEVSANLKQS